MTDAAQISKDTSPVQLGQRHDQAETRVEHRLTSDPALRALHGGALDDLGTVPERSTDALPQDVSTALSGTGRQLRPDTQRSMETAFGESFSDVRIHTDQSADRGARSIDSAAFAAGQNIAFASGAYQPDSPAGRGIIAHELAHVSDMRAGRDTPGIVRGVGPFQWLVRLFGGGTFSPEELQRFVRSLVTQGDNPEFSMQTDNMARVLVLKHGYHKLENVPELEKSGAFSDLSKLRVRYSLIQHLLHGFSSGEDQEAVLTILRDAELWEREQLVRKMTEDGLLDRFNGARQDQLTHLISGTTVDNNFVRGTDKTQDDNMPVSWKFNYSVETAGQLAQDIKGIALENFRISPDAHGSRGDRWTVIAQNALLQGPNGVSGENQSVPGNGDAVPHPKNSAGEARTDFWVVPRDPRLNASWASRLRGVVPKKKPVEVEDPAEPGQPYGNVQGANGQKVEANLTVKLGASNSGSTQETQEDSRSEGVNVGANHSRGRTDANGSGSRMVLGTENEFSSQDTISDSHSNTANASRRRARETMRNWHMSVTETREELRAIEMSGGFEQETGTETEIELGGELGAEAAASLALNAGLELGAELALNNPVVQRVLPAILNKVGGARGRVLAGILQLVDGASAGLNFSLSPEGSVSIRGQADARARRLWSAASRRNFQIGRQAANTDTSSATAGIGRAVTDIDETQVGVTAGDQHGRERSAGNRNTASAEFEASQNQQTEIMEQYQSSLEFQSERQQRRSVANTAQQFMPTVESAEISFRVMRDEWGAATLRQQPNDRNPEGAN
ncbi:MAG: DUF4157 domain-containing protein [Paracoccaceae bacterium]